MLIFSRTEAEEEGMVNKLMKRMAELRKEKEAIAMEAEREEEVRHALGVEWAWLWGGLNPRRFRLIKACTEAVHVHILPTQPGLPRRR